MKDHDESAVIEVASLDAEYQDEIGKPWLFQPDDDDEPDQAFDNEEEACAAQREYRIARGFNPHTGEKIA